MQWTPGGSDEDIEDRRDDSGGGGASVVAADLALAEASAAYTSALVACWS